MSGRNRIEGKVLTLEKDDGELAVALDELVDGGFEKPEGVGDLERGIRCEAESEERIVEAVLHEGVPVHDEEFLPGVVSDDVEPAGGLLRPVFEIKLVQRCERRSFRRVHSLQNQRR